MLDFDGYLNKNVRITIYKKHMFTTYTGNLLFVRERFLVIDSNNRLRLNSKRKRKDSRYFFPKKIINKIEEIKEVKKNA